MSIHVIVSRHAVFHREKARTVPGRYNVYEEPHQSPYIDLFWCHFYSADFRNARSDPSIQRAQSHRLVQSTWST